MPATMTRDRNTLILALATLGGATEIEMILSFLHHPRWPRQVQLHNCCVLLSPTVLLANFTNVNDPLLANKLCTCLGTLGGATKNGSSLSSVATWVPTIGIHEVKRGK
jgi:hypothetical protein